MSQFTEETVAELKKAMLARMPECLYTAEDYVALTTKTGLNHAQIEQWAKNMRFRYGQEDRERWLQTNELAEKVFLLRFQFWFFKILVKPRVILCFSGQISQFLRELLQCHPTIC